MFVSRFPVALVGLMIAIFAATGSAAPVPPERAKAEKELGALAVKLRGEWEGGPCEGQLTFRANGAYEWRGRGPGGDTDAGFWSLRSEGLTPVLILKCKTSDDPNREGKTVELPFDWQDETLTFKCFSDVTPMRFTRSVKEQARR